jgi:transcriptional regulator with XRE-family HTH domain
MQTAKKLLGMRVREVRRLRQLSQEKLAEKVGVDPKQISRIEGGKSAPSLDTLESLARNLQVEISVFRLGFCTSFPVFQLSNLV